MPMKTRAIKSYHNVKPFGEESLASAGLFYQFRASDYTCSHPWIVVQSVALSTESCFLTRQDDLEPFFYLSASYRAAC